MFPFLAIRLFFFVLQCCKGTENIEINKAHLINWENYGVRRLRYWQGRIRQRLWLPIAHIHIHAHTHRRIAPMTKEEKRGENVEYFKSARLLSIALVVDLVLVRVHRYVFESALVHWAFLFAWHYSADHRSKEVVGSLLFLALPEADSFALSTDRWCRSV